MNDSIQQIEVQLTTAEALNPQTVPVGTSKTVPQIRTMVSPFDGEMSRPPLQGQAFYQLSRLIRNDPTVRLVRELVMAPILRAGWSYESTDKAPEGALEKVKTIMDRMRIELLKSSMASCMDFGYAPYEIIVDSSWNLRVKPLLVDYTTILVNAVTGEFFGLKQQPQYSLTNSYAYLTRNECFIVAQDVEAGNLYGRATNASLVEVYDENSSINRASRKYDRKVAGTHWVIYYPLGSSMFNGVKTDNGEIAKELLSKAEAVGGIMVPRSVLQVLDTMTAQAASNEASQWKIELLSDKGAGQMAFENKLKYLDVLKVRAFGVPERAILEGQYGTKAEAETHADIAIANLEVRHQSLVDLYNYELTNKIVKWHYGVEHVGSVFIKPTPIDDLALSFNRQLYMQLLSDPNTAATEQQHIDMAALRDSLSVPELGHDEEVNANGDDWLDQLLNADDSDILTELGLSHYDPNQPRDALGQWGEGVAKSRKEQTGSPQFKKWFGDSKVVNEDGSPKIVYHGTADTFKEFDLDHPNRKDTGWLGTGVYLTTSADIASSYTNLKEGRDGGQIKPLYAKLENPYYAKLADKQRLQLVSHKEGLEAGRDAADAWTRELKSRGHDGVILKLPASLVGKANESEEIVVFSTNGVKSVTGNKGTFDSGNNDITLSNFNPDEPRDWHGRWALSPDTGGGSGGGGAKWDTERLGRGNRVKFTDGEHKGMSGTITGQITKEFKKEDKTYYIQIDGYPKPGGWSGQITASYKVLAKYAEPLADAIDETQRIFQERDAAEKERNKQLATKTVKEYGVQFETNKRAQFEYIHNTEKAPHMGADYQQDIEPAGKYVTHASPDMIKNRQPGWKAGKMTMLKPLVVALNTGDGRIYDDNSWKKRLSDAYGGATGEKLSKKIAADGHDGIVTVDDKGNTSEIVSLIHLAPKRPKSLSNFDPNQTRDENGQWADDGGPSLPDEWTEAVGKEWDEKQKKAEEIFKDCTEENKGIAHSVLNYMNRECLDRFIANAKKVIEFANEDEITEYYLSGKGLANLGANWGPNSKVQGSYASDGTLRLDGGSEKREVYAHEFGHAIDYSERNAVTGYRKQVSRTYEWRDAWEKEIKGTGNLSDYATTSQSEGFAEFARLVFSMPREARREFPQCYKVWKKNGLVDK